MKKGRKTPKKSAPKRSAKSTKRAALAVVVIAALSIIATGAAITSRRAAVKTEAARQASAAAPSNKNYTTVRVAGQDLQVDSQTGRLKPLSQEEAQRLAESLKQNLNRSTEGLVAEEQPDGSQTVDLQGRFENVAVARVNEDGTVSESCVDNVEAASAFFGIDPQLVGARQKQEAAGAKQSVRARPTKE